MSNTALGSLARQIGRRAFVVSPKGQSAARPYSVLATRKAISPSITYSAKLRPAYGPSSYSNRSAFHSTAASSLDAVPNIPKMQWAQVLEKDGSELEYKQIPVPQPASDELLVKIAYTGVCHTDLHARYGDWPLSRKMPLIGGHEGTGTVVARGDSAKDFELGDLAGIKWVNGSCLECEFCHEHNEPLCPDVSLSGYTVDGTFQQYAIAKAAHATKIRQGVPLDSVAPILCAGVTVYKGIKRAEVKPGQSIAIVGAGGGLGTLAIQYSKALGLQTIAIDGGQEKKNMCLELGADVSNAGILSRHILQSVHMTNLNYADIHRFRPIAERR